MQFKDLLNKESATGLAEGLQQPYPGFERETFMARVFDADWPGRELKERIRHMFLECARWPDDSKFTPRDMLTWHTARWAIAAKDAPPEVKAAAKARQGKPAGQALEALALNDAMVANPFRFIVLLNRFVEPKYAKGDRSAKNNGNNIGG